MKISNILNVPLIKELVIKIRTKKREQELDKLPLINYLLFENEFRGSVALIRKRQEPYIIYFKGCKNILDIGCGRGEFLELLKKERIPFLGIDNTNEMVVYCHIKNLKVLEIDLFDYLLKCKDNFHDGMIAVQVIEHLNSRRVQNFVKLCFNKLKKGSYVIVETVNPLCFQALSYFWADLTHEKPFVPQVLRHIFKQYGFSQVDIIGRTPVFPNVPDFIINPKDLAIYGDYAIIARK